MAYRNGLRAIGMTFVLLAGCSAGADVLSRAVVHHLDALTPIGLVDPSAPITVGVVFARPNPAGEEALAEALYDPNNAQYQQFLDPGEFATAFGVSPSVFQQAVSWLQSGGLNVTTIDGTTDYVLASGNAAQVGSLFGVTLSWFRTAYGPIYANTAAPTVPGSLPILTVYGLNNLNRFRTFHVTPSPSVPVTGLLTPQNLWWLYDQPSNNFGNGQTMAIFGWGVTPNTVANLRAFEQTYELPQVPITIRYFGSTSTPDTSDGADLEWDLDTQASTGMAPAVQGEVLYFAHHNTDTDILAALAAWVNDRLGPLQGSASFGECENVPQAEPVIGTDGLEDPGNQILRQAVIEGRTLFRLDGRHRRLVSYLARKHQRPLDAALPGAQLSRGEPLRGGRWRDHPQQRRGQSATAIGGTRLGVHGRRQQPVHQGRELPAGRNQHHGPLHREPGRPAVQSAAAALPRYSRRRGDVG